MAQVRSRNILVSARTYYLNSKSFSTIVPFPLLRNESSVSRGLWRGCSLFRLIKALGSSASIRPAESRKKISKEREKREVDRNIFRRSRLCLNYSERCAANTEKWHEKFTPRARYKASDLLAKLLKAETHVIKIGEKVCLAKWDGPAPTIISLLLRRSRLAAKGARSLRFASRTPTMHSFCVPDISFYETRQLHNVMEFSCLCVLCSCMCRTSARSPFPSPLAFSPQFPSSRVGVALHSRDFSTSALVFIPQKGRPPLDRDIRHPREKQTHRCCSSHAISRKTSLPATRGIDCKRQIVFARRKGFGSSVPSPIPPPPLPGSSSHVKE
ncbi:hypothetical protein PUN28_000634 [Cardiocondyla obscurior]|uniref:Ribosomal protein S14 n=1 Tax=Cardiocondyla obscurior TaxID=286306 RepID=A0AAW2H0F2_9HYME